MSLRMSRRVIRDFLFAFFVFFFVAMVAFAIFPGYAHAADPMDFKVASGAKDGTYSAMLNNAAQFCSAQEGQEGLRIVNVESSGSIDNLSKLLDNEVNAAFIQEDVLFTDKTDNLAAKVKTLLALHPEEIHVLTLTVSPLKEGGIGGTSFRAKSVVLNTFADLAGRKVAAAGGSVRTANLLRLQSEIPFSLVEKSNNNEVLAAIQSGEVAAGILVGGQPLGAIAKLGPEWKLLPIEGSVADRVAKVYFPTTLKYTKMSPSGIRSMATNALFVTSDYKSPRMVNALRTLRDCIASHLVDFQEMAGFHAKWRAVDLSNPGRWQGVYAFPAPVKPASVTKPAKAKKK